VILGALALPAIALAGKIATEGKIVGDSATKVTVRVIKNSGDVTTIRGFRAKGVLSKCGPMDQPNRINFRIHGAIPVGAENRFDQRFHNNDGSTLHISGKVRRHGRMVVGDLKARNFDNDDGQNCVTPKQRFKTHKV
jgi:hypothetical protein